jgi:hypothetical protein
MERTYRVKGPARQAGSTAAGSIAVILAVNRKLRKPPVKIDSATIGRENGVK